MFQTRILFRNFSSFFKPANAIRLRNNSLKDVLSENPKVIEWEKLRTELIAGERFVNNSNLDGIIIGMCARERRLDIAKSYMEFMKSKSLEVSDASTSKLLRLYHHHRVNNKEGFDSKDEEEILKICNKLLTKHKYLEASMAENVIHGLCLTKDWMRSLELLEHMKLTTKSPTSASYCAIISRALNSDNLEVAWKLLTDMMSQDVIPRVSIFIGFLEKLRGEVEGTERLLSLIGDHSVILPVKQVEDFRQVLGKYFESNVVEISRNGRCPSCSKKLADIQLNEEEFAKLSKKFLQDVLIRKDVFLKTSPKEVERFKNFIEKSMPFDCVIDGLNVAYSRGPQQPTQMFAKNVASAVKYFVDRNMSCLVIGRKHMNRWPEKEMSFMRRNSHLFLADDTSQDDPFLIYAALKSGPKTKIFSRDLMRGHSILLDSESNKLFRRWQLQQQYQLITTLQNNQILVQEPVGFELRAHKNGGHWHVPFTSENLYFSHETFELPARWLCLKI